MAALKVLNEQPNRLVLGKGGSTGVAALIGIGIFGIVACIGLSSILDESGGFNPVTILIVLVIGLAFFSNIARTLSSTRVVLDSNTSSATRTDAILLIPTRRQEMAFNLIRDVRVTQPRANSPLVLDSFPVWQVELQATDGTTLRVNEGGTRPEMDALAQRVGALLNRPVRAPNDAQAQPQAQTTTAAGSTPAGVMGSLYENLIAFAQSAAESANQSARAPTISAYPDRRPSSPQDDTERAAWRERYKRSTERQPQTPTLATASSPMDTDTTLLDASLNLTPSSVGIEAYNAFSAPPVAYTAPPVLVMPQMSGMLSFAPALVLPSFAPIGSLDVMSQFTTIPQEPEIKQVEVQVFSPSNSSTTSNETQGLIQTARQFYMARNLSQAEATYLRVLSTNPADAAVQNDLGVVYLEANKLRDAERAFRRAMALDPLGNTSRYNLGVTLYRMGNKQQANEQFRVGGQNVGREDTGYFRDAQRGVLRAPMLSPTT